MNIPSIETPHLLLRGWTPDDAGALFDILQEEDILRYFPNPAPPSREKVGNYISRQLANWEQFGYGHWAVVTREDDQVAGWCGLEHLAELNETEVAYLLSKRVWGRGFATEAARAAVRFGFETAGLEQIIGLVHPENAGSVRVLEKCGFALYRSDHIVGPGNVPLPREPCGFRNQPALTRASDRRTKRCIPSLDGKRMRRVQLPV